MFSTQLSFEKGQENAKSGRTGQGRVGRRMFTQGVASKPCFLTCGLSKVPTLFIGGN